MGSNIPVEEFENDVVAQVSVPLWNRYLSDP